MKKKNKAVNKRSVIKKITAADFTGIVFDVVFKAAIISLTAVLIGLAYTGVRKTITPVKVEAEATPQPAAAAPTPAPKPVKTVIAGKYVHLLKSVKTKEEIPKVHLEEAKALMDSGRALFIDARGKSMYDQAHIKGSVSIPAGTPPDKIKELEAVLKNKVLVTYCHGVGCHLADKVSYVLYDMGYRKHAIFFGGWNEWTQADYPVDKYEPPEQYKHLFLDAVSADKIHEVTLEEAKFLYDNMLANIMDVDPSDNYAKIHIDRAASMPFDKVDQLLPGYSGVLKEKPVLLYCHGIGRKSRGVAEKIFESGNKKVLLFIQALPQWEAAGYPLFKAQEGDK